ncbi:putative fatty acyl-CoA reductase CG5065 [Diaphorina citri]|nr:putative fatty acyl-CoA reductase CG5065 [Diaphorina citri]
MTNSKLWFFISSFFFHTIPSYILDTLISLGGYEPVLKRVHNRIKKGFDIFEYYTKNSWSFKNENLHALRNMMNEKEAIRYEIAMFRDLDEAKAYFEMCIHGARQYLLGEPPETLPGAKRHVRIMYYVHVITQVLLLGFFLWVLSKFFL